MKQCNHFFKMVTGNHTVHYFQCSRTESRHTIHEHIFAPLEILKWSQSSEHDTIF
jgi:hypothetical protein